MSYIPDHQITKFQNQKSQNQTSDIEKSAIHKPYCMLYNYLKSALRNLNKQKGIAFINLFGLSVGLACFILFLLYALNEFSFDSFHKDGKNIYRVYRQREKDGKVENGQVYMPMPLGPALRQDISGVANAIRFRDGWGENFVRVGNEVSRHPISFADANFFSVFSFPLKSGNLSTALQDLHSMVITEEMATALFGKADPMGKNIEVKIDETFENFTVTGVAYDIPVNSSIRFDLLGNFDFLGTTASGKSSVNNWKRSGYSTFVQMQPGAPLPGKQAMIAFRKKYYPQDPAKGKKKEEALTWYEFQPLQDIHTNTHIEGGEVPPVEVGTIWILLGIAASVLLIACINFTTLSIGRSAGRAREVGVRKVIGGNRMNLVMQFMTEAFLLSLFSALISLLLVQLLLPYFNDLSGRKLHFSLAMYPALIWLLIGVVVVVAFVSGSYPALVLSRFRPIEVLKTKMRLAGANFFTRSLVTVQFVFSAGLIIATVIILQQLGFMRSKSPGFQKENVVMVDAEGMETQALYPLFRQALINQPGIAGVTGAELGLGEGTGWSISGFKYNNKDHEAFEYFVADDYLKVMGLQLLEGRDFDPTIADDTVRSIIVNEAMVRDMGWTPENAVGQTIPGYTEKITAVVIGVVKDFNFLSFSDGVKPQLFHRFASYRPMKFFVRVRPGNPSSSLANIESAWKKLAPGYPFRYVFVEESLDRFYKSEQKWSSIVGWAGGISIFLACLGLLGLTMLSVLNRMKEIGIRKVLGASVGSITALISKDFLKLVVIALVIAVPIASYFMNRWLENFAYRISISWTVFLMTALMSLLIAFITIGIQAVRAAMQNPVKSLRTE